MPHSGVQLQARSQRRRDRASAARPRSARARTRSSPAIVAEVLGIEPIDIRVVTGDTDLTPVDLGSYSSRVTLMMGNAAIQAAERARAMIVGRPRRRSSRCPAERVGVRRRPRLRRASPDTGVSFAEAVVAGEAKFGTLGTAGSYTPPSVGRAVQGRRRRPVARLLVLRRAWSRWRSIRETGDVHGRRRSGSRTTSAVRSTRCSCGARSRAASTWGSARR